MSTTRKPASERQTNSIPIRFDTNTHDALRALAAADDRTVSGYIRMVLKRHIAEQEANR